MDNNKDKETMTNQEDLSVKQQQFITDVFHRQLPVTLYGGFAEEALLNGKVTMPHHDVDMVALRNDLEMLEKELGNLMCHVEQAKRSPDQPPYKLAVKKGDVDADIMLIDWDEQKKQPYMESMLNGKRTRFYFDANGLSQPQSKLGELDVQTVSPLFQMQLRNIFQAATGVAPRELDIKKQTLLRDKFFPGEDLNLAKFKPETVEIE